MHEKMNEYWIGDFFLFIYFSNMSSWSQESSDIFNIIYWNNGGDMQWTTMLYPAKKFGFAKRNHQLIYATEYAIETTYKESEIPRSTIRWWFKMFKKEKDSHL